MNTVSRLAQVRKSPAVILDPVNGSLDLSLGRGQNPAALLGTSLQAHQEDFPTVLKQQSRRKPHAGLEGR